MNSGRQYIFILFVALYVFSHHSLGFDVLPQETIVTQQHTLLDTKKSNSIHNTIKYYNPLRLLTVELPRVNLQQLYKIKPSIHFDKKFNNPVSYHFRESSIKEKRIQLNITIKF